MPFLEVSGVSVRLGATRALCEASLALDRGERVALLGCNGSGKTSLLLAIAGLLPHSGTIRIDGERLSPRTAPALRQRTGFIFAVPEDQLLFPEVLEDVAFGVVQRGATPSEARRQAQLALASLDAERLIGRTTHELSHGERLRVALAGATVTRPPLLLLDEPSAGLDPPARRRLAALLTELTAAQLVATHDLGFARRICQRYVMLKQGRVVAAGTLDSLPDEWED